MLEFCLGWICAGVLGILLTCLSISDTLKQILRELKTDKNKILKDDYKYGY